MREQIRKLAQSYTAHYRWMRDEGADLEQEGWVAVTQTQRQTREERCVMHAANLAMRNYSWRRRWPVSIPTRPGKAQITRLIELDMTTVEVDEPGMEPQLCVAAGPDADLDAADWRQRARAALHAACDAVSPLAIEVLEGAKPATVAAGAAVPVTQVYDLTARAREHLRRVPGLRQLLEEEQS